MLQNEKFKLVRSDINGLMYLTETALFAVDEDIRLKKYISHFMSFYLKSKYKSFPKDFVFNEELLSDGIDSMGGTLRTYKMTIPSVGRIKAKTYEISVFFWKEGMRLQVCPTVIPNTHIDELKAIYFRVIEAKSDEYGIKVSFGLLPVLQPLTI